MPFLILDSAELRSAKKELVWRIYAAAKTLPTTERVQIIELAGAELNNDDNET